jgi:Reverse transcriptase (RNA-dependent DNA polymerase)
MLAPMKEVDFETWCKVLLASTKTDLSPTSEAIKGHYALEFEKAIAKEYASLDKNQAFQEHMLPSGKSLLDTKMVLKNKETATLDMPLEFKARLCGKRFRQIFDVDYHETYAPVACYSALRLFISILVSIDYEI